MIVRQRAQLPGRIDSVALGPGGNLGAVAADGDRLHRFDLAGGRLEPLPALPIPPDLHRPSWAAKVDFADTRAAFLDDRTILLGRIMDRRTDSGEIGLRERLRTCLLAIDAETGAVKGDYDCPGGLVLSSDPLPLSPRHVLLGLPDNALCIDAESWRKVDQLRALDDDFNATDEEGADTDEQVAPNGLAFSPASGLLSVLWCYFNAAIVQSYRFDPARGTFARHRRGDAFEGKDAGYEARGLCTSPDGEAVAAWLPIFDKLLRPPDVREDLPPLSIRLGRLLLAAAGGVRLVDVSLTSRPEDLMIGRHIIIEGGREAFRGWRYGVEEAESRPTFLDDGRIVLNTPGGRLLGIDPESGRVEVLHDLGSPVAGMAFHRESRRLLAGCQDGTVALLEA